MAEDRKRNDQNLKIGVLLYTYNRIDDARINLEIIRNAWKDNELLWDATVVHAFNGKREWWPEKYLEDELLYLENPGHFGGAEILLNKGIEVFAEKYPDTDYVIVLAADTWCVMPEYLENAIKDMRANEKYLAVSAWGTKKESDMFKVGMSLDFNIVDLAWATRHGLFPIRYKEFYEDNAEVFFYQDETIYPERVFALRFKQAIVKSIKIPSENLIKKIAQEHIHHLIEREPVHAVQSSLFGGTVWKRKMYWPNIGLITHHDPVPKQRALVEWVIPLGKYGERFLKARDLGYYNDGLTKTYYSKGKKKIDYED